MVVVVVLLLVVVVLGVSMLVTGTSGCWMNTSGEVGTLSVGDEKREGEITSRIGVDPAEDETWCGINVGARE